MIAISTSGPSPSVLNAERHKAPGNVRGLAHAMKIFYKTDTTTWTQSMIQAPFGQYSYQHGPETEVHGPEPPTTEL